MATVTLFAALFNLFTSLLHLLAQLTATSNRLAVGVVLSATFYWLRLYADGSYDPMK